MFDLLFAARPSLWNIDLWYAIPVIIAVSLVYSATRHEQMRPILVHSGRIAVLWTVGLAAIFAVINFVSWLV